MKTIPATMLILMFLAASLVSWQLWFQPNSTVIGGTYTLRSGDAIRGDLRTLFAQVTVEEGARVEGRITAVSSAVDISGSVGGRVLAIGSEVKLNGTADLTESPRHVDTIPYVILLPEMMRAGTAVRLPR